MIAAFLKRRWWLTQNRILTSITLALLTPVIIYISVVTVMDNIILRSIDGLPYDQWAFPGLIMVIAMIGLFPLLYRDFFDLRIHRHILQPITLAPISKMEIVAGITITAIIESLTYVIIGSIVLYILIPMPFVWYNYLIIYLYVILFNAVIANIFVTMGLLTDRVTTYMFMVLSFMIFILFGSGLLVEFEFYPSLMGAFFANLPTSVLMQGLRQLIFENRFDWVALVYPLAVIAVWFGLNSVLFRIKFRQ
ncbi:MAG: ABC transporter permease [Candidatus Neomarinimicrobiota bacterium]